MALIASTSTKILMCGGIPVRTLFVSHEFTIWTWVASSLHSADWRYIEMDLAAWFGGKWCIACWWKNIAARHRLSICFTPSISWWWGKTSDTARSIKSLTPNTVSSNSTNAGEDPNSPFIMLNIEIQCSTNSSPTWLLIVDIFNWPHAVSRT